MDKPAVIILGKLPPPYMGPSIATEIILNSGLKDHFRLIHLDTKTYDHLNEFGKWSFKKVFRNISRYVRLTRLIRQHDPAVVWIPVSQTSAGFLKDAVYIWISSLMGRKIMLHLRGSNFKTWVSRSSSLMKFIVRKTLKRCHGVIVLGKKLRPLFTEYFNEDRIYVVPNGADYVFPAQSSGNGVIRLLYIANLQPSKGIEDVINAVLHLDKSHRGAYVLDVLGSWRNVHTRENCENLISRHQLPVTIHTPDTNPDKFRFLADSDIFVFTPRSPEGHPWVIVEAMAAGLPIISTDQGAITESVEHEVNGYIVNTPDSTQIASLMKQLIENPELRKRMGQESRKKYLEEFTEEKMVLKLKEALQDLIKK